MEVNEYSTVSLTRFRRRIPQALLALSLLSMMAISWMAQRSISTNHKLEFEAAIHSFTDELRHRIEAYPKALTGVRALVETTPALTPELFRQYVESLDLARTLPGFEGVGLIPKVKREQLPEFLFAARQLVQSGFALNPDYEREEYFPTLYLEPLDTVRKGLIGFDMFTQPEPHHAMQLARDSGDYAMSGAILFDEFAAEGEGNGFMIYLPIYRSAASSLTSESERRSKLAGFLYIPVRAADFFRASVTAYSDRLGISIFDSERESHSFLFTSATDQSAQHCKHCMQASHALSVGGKTLGLQFSALTDTADEEFWVTLGLCLSQIIIIYGIWRLAREQGEANRAAEKAALEKDRLLLDERAVRQGMEKAAQLKDEFLSTLSHELRSPLNTILGWAQLINRDAIPREQFQKAAQTIERNVRVQAQLIENLLDMSRLTKGNLELERKPIDVNTVIAAATDMAKSAMEAKNISLRLSLQHAPLEVFGDGRRLQQALWNILSNAVKFSPTGGTITLRTESTERLLHLTIQDTGPGITPEFMPHLFEQFMQADGATTRKHGGLGLGLAMAKNIIELHGGSIEARSNGAGTGALFCISLPATTMSPSANAGPLESDENVLAGVPVLIVDDEHDAREILQKILESAGMSVSAARSMEEAVSLIEKRKFKIIVSDLSMPEHDGFELAQRIRMHHDYGVRALPMIALSALVRSDDRRRALQSGFSAHSSKPLEARALISLIAELLHPVYQSADTPHGNNLTC